MSDISDQLDFCKQALGELGTRSTITSLVPPDGSQEAYYCNLFFDGTRDQILRAAHWGFAGRTNTLQLWKAAPGTPENPEIPANTGFNVRVPAPPWLYSYRYQFGDAIQVRRVRPQSDQGDEMWAYGGAPPRQTSVPFEIASDRFDRLGQLVSGTYGMQDFPITTPGTNYKGGDFVYFTSNSTPVGQPACLFVSAVDFGGGVASVLLVDRGSFLHAPTTALYQFDTTGVGTGLVVTPTSYVLNSQVLTKVVLTNARNAIMDFTTADVPVSQYDALFADAFMLALEGKLALALLGDRGIYTAKLQEANNAIINARVRDGNESLTTYEHVPDWLQVRGVASMGISSSWYNPPYGPLFAVGP